MDEGRLTDSYGQTVDFRNTIIIMTSNVGSRQVKELGRGIGFARYDAIDADNSRSIIQKALNKSFAPEFLNRIDEIITFDPLNKDAIDKIVELELKKVSNRLNTMGYQLSVSDDAKQFIASKGFDVQFGARPLKRAVQSYVEDGIAELLVAGGMLAEATIVVDVDKEENGKLSFHIAQKEE